MEQTTFVCSVSPCGIKGPAEAMWNIDRKATSGKLVIVCGPCAREARRHDIRAYRLSETIKLDAEREAKRLARSWFFQAFEKAKNKKAERSAANRGPV